MKYLIVAAHPDDEVLGAGATIHKAAKNSDEIGRASCRERVCMFV